MNRGRVAVLFFAVLAGCPRGGGRSATGDRPVGLADLADRIDPGPVPPLLSDMPPSVERLIGKLPAVASPELRAEAQEALVKIAGELAAGAGNVSLADLDRILKIFLALAVVEEKNADRCDLACLSALQQIYGLLDIPWLADQQGFMSQIVDIGATAMVQAGLSQAEVKATLAYIRSVFRLAPRRHAYIAVRLFRRHPESPATLSALRRIGHQAAREEDYDLAMTAFATAAERPSRERAGDLVELASVCYRALRQPCGDRRLEEARQAAARDPAMAERLTGAAETGRLARAASRASRGRRFEDRIELGHILVDLSRRKHAIRLFEELRVARPRDARPLVGLARAHFDQMASTTRMREYLKQASTLANRDLRYYELTVGTAFTAILPTIQQIAATPDITEAQVVARLATHLAPLRADLEGLARFAPSRAAVLQVLVDGAVEVVAMRGTSVVHIMPVIARAWRRALEIRGKYPAEPDVHKLVSLVGGFGPVPIEEVEAAVTEPLPDGLADRDAVIEGRASLYLRMVLYGARLDWIPRLEALVASLPASSWIARNLRADTVALAVIAGRGTWDPVVNAYRELLPDAPDDPERARIENNIGVALYRAGKRDDARAAWDHAMQLEPEYPVPDLNHAAASDGAPYGLEKLTEIASSAGLAGVGFQAAAWRRHFGLARGEKAASIEALRKEHFADSYGFAPDGGLGAIVGGSFKVSFGYHSSKRLVIELSTEAKTWLCLPAPETLPKTKR